ncbi:MAG: hypothetical protein EAZ81_09645 [Verrucomicrobia bacterium]|jgi:hypothetical protein|nr:MAG: hypothetical protein EAZ81_09645 [Verrucomicrobiota bacterium]
MPRRASSGPKSSVIIGIAAFLIVAFLGAKMLTGERSAKIKGSPPLSMAEFLENGNSLRGNEYLVQGTVDQRWPRDNGQVVSLQVENSEDLIGIEIPSSFNDLNIERAQKYAIKVKFREGGIPVATQIERL